MNLLAVMAIPQMLVVVMIVLVTTFEKQMQDLAANVQGNANALLWVARVWCMILRHRVEDRIYAWKQAVL